MSRKTLLRSTYTPSPRPVVLAPAGARGIVIGIDLLLLKRARGVHRLQPSRRRLARSSWPMWPCACHCRCGGLGSWPVAVRLLARSTAFLFYPAPQLRHPRSAGGTCNAWAARTPLQRPLQLCLPYPLFNTPGHAVYAVRICLLAARHSASQNLGAEYGAAKEGRSGGWNQ